MRRPAPARLLALALLHGGCEVRHHDDSRPHWITIRATQLHVGTLEADIPTGWRDVNELVNKRPHMTNLPPGSRMLVLDRPFADGTGEIVILPMGATTITGDACSELAELWKSELPEGVTLDDVQAANFGGSPGCTMKQRSKHASAADHVAIFTRAGTTAVVRCGGTAYSEVDSACDKIIYGLRDTTK